MIVKIKLQKKPNFKKLLEYMLHDKDRLFDKNKKSFLITHNLKGNALAHWVNQYKENETFRKHKRINSVILSHEIVSWHKDDAKHITLEKLEQMAREYIKLRNPRGMFVAVPHFDKQHYHIHFCVSGIEYRTGKVMRLSREKLQALKKDFQQFQITRFPELSHSIVGHGKGEKPLFSDKEFQMKLNGRETDKEKILAVLKTCYNKANSKESFFELVKECGLNPYERGGKITGLVFQNRKFRLKRLGWTEERIAELDVGMKRGRELERLREKYKGKELRRTK